MDAVYTDMIAAQNIDIEETVSGERNRLLNFIRKRVRHEEDAQDILQDVFWQLIEAYRGFETIERVTSRLYRVARNKIADSYRKKKPAALPRAATEREEGAGPYLDDILADASPGPEELYIRDVIWNEIETAVEDLPPPQREVFIWHAFEGMSFREMSELTGDSENALRMRKLYARRSLRKRLESLYDEI